jgi:hypothetical protein
MIDGLLNLAEELAGQDDAVKKRKAISIAYYAAFHAFCEMIADGLVEDPTSPIYIKLYRHIDHGVFNREKIFQINDNKTKNFEAIRTSLSDLKQKREEADYFPASAMHQFNPHDSISKARNTIELIRAIDKKQQRDLALNILVNGGNMNRGSTSNKSLKPSKA